MKMPKSSGETAFLKNLTGTQLAQPTQLTETSSMDSQFGKKITMFPNKSFNSFRNANCGSLFLEFGHNRREKRDLERAQSVAVMPAPMGSA